MRARVLKRRHRNSRRFFVAGSDPRFIGVPTLDRRTPRASQTHSIRHEMSAFTVATSAIGTSPASRVPTEAGSRPAPVARSAPCVFQIGFVRFRRVFIPSPSGLPALASRDISASPGRRRGGGGFGVRAMTSNPIAFASEASAACRARALFPEPSFDLRSKKPRPPRVRDLTADRV